MLELSRVRKARTKRNAIVPRFDKDEELAARFESRLVGPFLRSVEFLEDSARDAWRRQVARGSFNPWAAIDALPWEEFGRRLFPGVVAGTEAVYTRARDAELLEDFDIKIKKPTRKADGFIETEPSIAEALSFEFIQLHGAELVTAITNSTREGMKQILEAIVLESPAPEVIARRLVEDGLGLFPKWSQAVTRRYELLIANDYPEDQARKIAAKYKKKLIRSRARMIARTETIRARSVGIEHAWEIAMSEGQLDPIMGKIWIAKSPCPICLELANLPPVPVSEPFQGPDGPIYRPPAHPNCKCGIGLVDPERGLSATAQRMREAQQNSGGALGREALRREAQAIQREIAAELGIDLDKPRGGGA
jgi:hypothetical protein